MKKIFIFLILGILLAMPLISSANWDNKLAYSESDLKVTIKNSILGLIPTSEIGTAKLESHPSVNYVKKFGAGNQTTMWYDFDFLGLYLNGLGKVYFIDRTTGKEINRDYSFVYWGEKERDVYDQECYLSINKTQTCESIVVGKETYETWLPYNSLDIPKGKIRIGLETYVEVEDKIDGVWTIAGKKVRKHAEWDASLDVGLVECWKLEEIVGTTAYGELFTHNLTNTNMVIDQDGVDGRSYAGGNNKYLSNSTGFSFPTGDFSVSGYFYHNSLKDYTGLFQSNPSNTGWYLLGRANGSFLFTLPGVAGFNTPGAIVTGQWQKIVLTHESDDWKIIVGNVSVKNVTSSWGDVVGDFYIANDRSNLATRGLDGRTDEICVWNRTLTITEAITYDMIYPLPTTRPSVTLNFPINHYNSTSPTITCNGTVIDIGGRDIVNVSLYIDGVLNETNSSGINNTDYYFTKIFTDGDYNWTYEAFNNQSASTTATTRLFNINTTPLIQFENPTPVNYYNSSSSYIPINVSLTETYFENITFSFYNGSLTEFYYEDSTRFINESLADGLYNYNVTIWTTTDQTNTTETRNITIDATPPEVILLTPSLIIDHHLINTNFSVNWSANDTHIDTCILQFEGVNRTVTCSDNQTQINITNIINRSLIFYVNDTFGHMNSTLRSWTYTVFENSQTFNNETFEGVINTFIANVTIEESNPITIASFIYNGTINTNSFYQSGNDSILTIDFLVPDVITDTNLTFYWSLTLSDSQIINLTPHNQTVISLSLDDCSVNTVVLYNYTVVDEGNQSKLSSPPSNTTIELNINLLDIKRETYIVNFSKKYSKINPFAVCINKELLSSTYVVDSIVKYEAINYAVEYYNIVNATITNSTIPINITLYDLASADSTEFKITFKAEDFTLVENALIYIDRQYIAENNTFKTVELPKTDSNSQTIGHFVRNDVVYNIRVIKDGEVLGNFKNVIAFCEDYTIGACQMVLEATPEALVIFDYDEQLGIIFQTLPAYNENTSSISFDFSTDDGTAKTVSMDVTRDDIFGNRSICNNTLTSSSGTLTCSFDPNIDDSVLRVNILVDGQPVVLSNVKLESSDYGNLGYVLWFFLTFLFILLFGHSKTEVLIGLAVSFIGAISLGITRGDIIGLGSAGIWVLVIIILGIVKLNKDRPQ